MSRIEGSKYIANLVHSLIEGFTAAELSLRFEFMRNSSGFVWVEIGKKSNIPGHYMV